MPFFVKRRRTSAFIFCKAKRFPVTREVGCADDFDAQGRPFQQRLGNRFNFLLSGALQRVCAGRNSINCKSSAAPPSSPPSAAKGEVATFVITFTNALSTTRPYLKSGSFKSPRTGISMSIRPRRSFSNATARRTGSPVASGLRSFLRT